MNLEQYVLAVHQEMRATAMDRRFDADQQRLLLETVKRFERYASPTEFAQPLGLLYLVMRA